MTSQVSEPPYFFELAPGRFFIVRLKTEVLIDNTGWFYTQMYRYGMCIKYGVSHHPRDQFRQWYTDRRIRLVLLLFKKFMETVGEEGANSRWAVVLYYGTGAGTYSGKRV